MFLAVLLDKEIRFSRFYQTAIYLPVVLSLALVGFIWQLIYSRDQGLLNAVLHTQVDWYGDPNYNLWAALVATSWRHIGYIMLLYLAGLKAVDGTLREAAAIDGASMTAQPTAVPRPDTGPGDGPRTPVSARKNRVRRLSGGDLVVVTLMTVIPTLFVLALVWFPAIASVLLSFTNWNGIGPLNQIKGIGFTNYVNVATNYPPFWPALRHNLTFLAVLFFIATPIGMFLAVLLDKEMRFSRFYQTAIYLPVVLSLALVGFIWQLIYSRDQGLLNAVLHTQVDWYGDPNYNLWAALVATSWRHIGYIMLLYLAGLKAVDGSLREAAAIDGASEVQTFFRVVFPVMRPINVIVLVVTVIESLRAFDLVWVINKGRNGLELIATLVTANVVGEASRIGFGSAMATIMLLISSVFVAVYVSIVMREERRK